MLSLLHFYAQRGKKALLPSNVPAIEQFNKRDIVYIQIILLFTQHLALLFKCNNAGQESNKVLSYCRKQLCFGVVFLQSPI